MASNQNVMGMLDTFIEGMRMQKKAAEPATALYSTGKKPDGLTPVVEGARSKEHSSDVENYGVSDNISDPSSVEGTSEGTVNTGDADQAPALNPKAQPNEKDVFGKAGALKTLGDSILTKMAKQTAAVAPVKTAAAAPVADFSKTASARANEILDTASDDAALYTNYLTGYAKGISKKAMDEEAMYAEAMDEEGGAMGELQDVAGEAGVGPEAMEATLGNEAGGLSPEELAILSELEAAGITLEDIEALLEEQAAGGGEMAPEEAAMEGVAPEDIEALAEAMPADDVDTAVMGADKIASAAKILGVHPHDLFKTLFNKG